MAELTVTQLNRCGLGERERERTGRRGRIEGEVNV